MPLEANDFIGRANIIGASEVANILGLGYETPFKFASNKRKRQEDEAYRNAEAKRHEVLMRMGNDLEELGIELYAEHQASVGNPITLVDINQEQDALHIDDKHGNPLIVAHPDGRVRRVRPEGQIGRTRTSQTRMLEVKTTTPFATPSLGREVPDHYYVQCQMQMHAQHLSGGRAQKADSEDLAIMDRATGKFYVEHLQYDPEFCEKVVAHVEHFRDRYLLCSDEQFIARAKEITTAKDDIFDEIKLPENQEEVLHLDTDSEDLEEKLQAFQAIEALLEHERVNQGIKELTAESVSHKNTLQEIMGEAQELVIDELGVAVRWKTPNASNRKKRPIQEVRNVTFQQPAVVRSFSAAVQNELGNRLSSDTKTADVVDAVHVAVKKVIEPELEALESTGITQPKRTFRMGAKLNEKLANLDVAEARRHIARLEPQQEADKGIAD